MRKSYNMMRKKGISRAGKICLAIFVWLFSAFVLISLVGFVFAQYSAAAAKPVWAEWQNDYINFLNDSYNNDASFCLADEDDYITSDVTMAEVYSAKYNDLRYMATHNSYKTGLTAETAFLYHAPFAAFMGKKYDYVFDTITEQLSCGIRSFEFDPGKVYTDDGTFKIECIHSDLLETNSTMVDMKKGMLEIKMWMDRNPDAVPLTLLIEPKGGASFDAEAFEMLDGIFFDVFGDKLMTPADFLGDYEDFDAFRAADAYPTVESMKGKIVIFLHEKDSLAAYIERDPDMQNSAMCIALEYKKLKTKHPEYSKYGFMAIINNASRKANWVDEAINEYNYMVRCRLDEYRVVKEKVYEAGLNSGANILSTDYPPMVAKRLYDYPIEVSAKYGYSAVLYEAGKTLTLRK